MVGLSMFDLSMNGTSLIGLSVIGLSMIGLQSMFDKSTIGPSMMYLSIIGSIHIGLGMIGLSMIDSSIIAGDWSKHDVSEHHRFDPDWSRHDRSKHHCRAVHFSEDTPVQARAGEQNKPSVRNSISATLLEYLQPDSVEHQTMCIKRRSYL